ncbi:hypothetical protein ACFSJS_22570 [Streptomyces desertarenae]|uniref:Uncharacterized protein n=1 Tax=Streptomyces desertarenae TaxID=2666184 RepID=A0ABW4PNW8_9ACTN
MYCTLEQARDAGTTGDDTEVTAWIEAAQDRITAYTSQLFEPTVMAVVADVGAGGLVILPRRVRAVTAVVPYASGDDGPALPPSAYRVTSSEVLGAIDAVHLAVGGWDDLVAGAESYSGGWAGLWDRWGADQVRVEGTFGYAQVPPLVARATALLAAHLQAEAQPDDDDAPDAGLDVDDEGNNVAIEDAEPDDGPVSPRASTGSPQVDALLVNYVNTSSRVVGV